jgi:tetratricopeptide (TPR) repeat protein
MQAAELLLQRGIAAQRTQQWEAAASHFRATLAIAPDLWEARGRLGDVLAVLDLLDSPPPPGGGEWTAFLRHFQVMLATDIAGAAGIVDDYAAAVPDTTLRLFLLRTSVANRCVDHAGMLAIARAAVAAHPDSVHALQILGQALVKQGAAAEALPVLETLVERHHLLAMQANRAFCLHRLGRAAAASAGFTAGMRVLPQRGARTLALEYGLMQALRETGDLDGALASADRLQEVTAETPDGLVRFAGVLKRWEAAVPAIESKRAFTLAMRAAHRAGAAVDFYPYTKLLPDEAEDLPGITRGVWIFKPENFAGGQGIRVTDSPASLGPAGRGVLQRYIDDPMLIGGLKSHLRLYLLVTGTDPLQAWMWEDGIVRFAPRPFSRGGDWMGRLDMHVTNTALHRGNPLLQVVQSEADAEGHVWSLDALVAALPTGEEGRAAFRARLRQLGRDVVVALAAVGSFAKPAPGARFSYPPKLFGLDVVVDARLRPWLAEVQYGPGLQGNALVDRINERLLRAVQQLILEPVRARAGTAAEIAKAEDAVCDRFVRFDGLG